MLFNSRRNVKIRDIQIRNTYKKKEFDQIFYKLILKNEKIKHYIKSLFFNRNRKSLAFLSKTNNVCIITGRTRSVYKKFRLTRFIVRELGAKGFIFGLKKLSW